MGKLKNYKTIYQGGILIKNIFKYLLEHPSGVKKKKIIRNYALIMIVSFTVITIYKNFNN